MAEVSEQGDRVVALLAAVAEVTAAAAELPVAVAVAVAYLWPAL
jgi:hypothetical protein